jgi:3-ketosteroid 9alpha-monooxygenase subunit A
MQAEIPRSPLTPYPRGWFLVAFSSELPASGVLPLYYFGRHLVAYRTDDGKAHVSNAYCPHMGAHLGHGGVVSGSCLRCPFHGWTFDGDSGQALSSPYGKKLPPGAKLRLWTVEEVSGMILVWFHDKGEPPTWSVPDEATAIEGDWTDWKETRWKLRARIQDVTENDLDAGHLPVLHDFAASTPTAELQVNGPQLKVTMNVELNLSTFGLPGSVISPLYTTKHGLSIGFIHQTVEVGELKISSWSLGCTTPIDAEHVDLRLLHRIRKTGNEQLDQMIDQNYFSTFKKAVDEDAVIWENKAYLMRPQLCEGDGLIGHFRKWSRQFYDETEFAAAYDAPAASTL